MFSFFNKFMLRSLFIKSLFILVLPLSTEFAMKEDIEMLDGVSGKIITKNTNNFKLRAKNKKGPCKQYRELLLNGDIDSTKEKRDASFVAGSKSIGRSKKEEITHRFTQSLSAIFIGAYDKNRQPDPIFDYRCETFLFFCPLVFNSLLNFIFEIDNKPSGMFLNFFSVGWRTPLFLKFITFDIHFNWFLFAISAYFDFVYFPAEYCSNVSFSELKSRLENKNIIPLFLFSFVFSAVSLCVNFKVDDYFYITVNLSFILRSIINGFFVSEDRMESCMNLSYGRKEQNPVPGHSVYNYLYKDYYEGEDFRKSQKQSYEYKECNGNTGKKDNNGDIIITECCIQSNCKYSNFGSNEKGKNNTARLKNESLDREMNSSKSMLKKGNIYDEVSADNEEENSESYSFGHQRKELHSCNSKTMNNNINNNYYDYNNENIMYMKPGLLNSQNKFNRQKRVATNSLIDNLSGKCYNNIEFFNETPGDVALENDKQRVVNIPIKKNSVIDLFKNTSDDNNNKLFDINEIEISKDSSDNDIINNTNRKDRLDNEEINVRNSLMDIRYRDFNNMDSERQNENFFPINIINTNTNTAQVNNIIIPEVKEEKKILNNNE